jgi:sugar/nucleoside kinase (ribokinase family)
MSRPRVALIGDAFVDVCVSGLERLPAWSEDRSCSGVRMVAGGSCGNTARQLASLTHGEFAVSFFTATGDDEAGALFRRTLLQEGLLIDVERTVQVLPSTPQSTCIVLSGPSDRAMISCYTSNERISTSVFGEQLPPPDGSRGWSALQGRPPRKVLHTRAALERVCQSPQHAPSVSQN